MGKQAHDPRLALANALNKGKTAVAVKPKEVKEAAGPNNTAGRGKGAGRRKKDPSPEIQKSRREIEAEQRRLVEENEKQKEEFYAAQATKKAQDRKGIEGCVTYVEDKDTRKPVAVNDISEFWTCDLGALPFMPDDNVGPVDVPEGVDVHLRLDYLRLLRDLLRRLLKMKFNVFWSQVIYDASLRRCLDSYLRFCLRAHDVPDDVADQLTATNSDEDPVAAEEQRLAREISGAVLAVMLRLSRPQETSHDFLSDETFANFIYEHGIFDVPKLIDICAIYGDSNRTTVTKMVHGVFAHQPRYVIDFQAVVQDMLDSLQQCCTPLQQSADATVTAGGSRGGSSSSSSGVKKEAGGGLSVDECLVYLPDVLSCFLGIFCFFPEECREPLLNSSLDGGLPLADVLAVLHEAVTALGQRSVDGSSDEDAQCTSACKTSSRLLARLLSCVLGLRMSPRRGVAAFQDLLDWLKEQADRGSLLADLGKHGMENVAMEWLASGLTDEAQLDYLEELCGSLLPKEARARRRHGAATAKAKSAAGGSSGAAPSRTTAGSDAAKIREVRDIVGTDFGEGMVLQCLLHYGGSVPAVVGAILDGSLPPQLQALPQGLALNENPAEALAPKPEKAKLSADEKKRVLDQAGRMDREATDVAAAAALAAESGEVEEPVKFPSMYDDDVDDTALVPQGFGGVGGNQGSDLDGSDAEENGDASSSGEEGDGSIQWRNNRGRGGREKGKGKGRGKGEPVQGQTIEARRKEANKAKVANHNRKSGALRKMAKAM
mmetsp:Transcript_88452/g.175886  ORF Transcript_88452/g.175886 Transcript_88452/m.175886 type:complete len:773 (-) Transcript_88452:105-2423(-)